MTIHEFEPVSPGTLCARTDEELLFIAAYDRPAQPYAAWVSAEMARRQALAIRTAVQALHNETTRLTTSSGNLEKLTQGMITETAQVRQGVASLNSYSDKLEHLTERLIVLTWVLIVLAALAVLVPVGVEVWHAYLELAEPVPPLVIQHRGPVL